MNSSDESFLRTRPFGDLTVGGTGCPSRLRWQCSSWLQDPNLPDGPHPRNVSRSKTSGTIVCLKKRW